MKINSSKLAILGIFVVGLGLGWMGKDLILKQQLVIANDIQTLRLTGYKYISPLLTCNIDTPIRSLKLSSLKNKLEELINERKKNFDVNEVSLYFRDLNSSISIGISVDEKYYPASLNKIPLMITAFKEEEANPGFLTRTVTMPDVFDPNWGLEIKPRDYLKTGNKYSINEAIEKLIENSDNNAFYLLSNNLDLKTYGTSFKDLRISLEKDSYSTEDYINVEDFSFFLRVLYNATYLNREYSEKALELLTKTNFSEGLVAGVPNNIQVAHKFGLLSNMEKETVVSRELHDCGIIYYPNRPYLLCVMTKSTSTLERAEAVIASISRKVYEEVGAQYGE
jgi:beta-lactamase class A